MNDKKPISRSQWAYSPLAWSACRKAMTVAEKGLDVKTTNITLEKYLFKYLETHAKPNFKPTSYDTEKNIIEARIIPVLGKVKLQALTPRAIKAFMLNSGRNIQRIT